MCRSAAGDGKLGAATPVKVPTRVVLPVPCSRIALSQKSMQGKTVGGGFPARLLGMHSPGCDRRHNIIDLLVGLQKSPARQSRVSIQERGANPMGQRASAACCEA